MLFLLSFYMKDGRPLTTKYYLDENILQKTIL